MGLYKCFRINKKEINELQEKYDNLKKYDVIRKYNFKRIYNGIYNLNYDYFNRKGDLRYLFHGFERIEPFNFYWEYWKEDLEYYNIFFLENWKLKNAFAKLNRKGLGLRKYYELVYRRILNFPYLITIKPKTIIINNYKSDLQYIIETVHTYKFLKYLENKDQTFIKIKMLYFDTFSKLKNKNINIEKIFTNFNCYKIIKKIKKFNLDKSNRKINILIKNINSPFNIIWLDYELKRFWIKWKMFNLFKDKYSKRFIKFLLDYYNECFWKDIWKYILNKIHKIKINKNKYNNTFYFLKKYIYKHKKIITYKSKENMRKEDRNLYFELKNIVSLNKNIIRYSFFSKIYLYFFFWILIFLNKIFFFINQILFNLWVRFYYFLNSSYKFNVNKLFYSYSILYENIEKLYKNVEFENTFNIYYNQFHLDKDYIFFLEKNEYNLYLKYFNNYKNYIFINIYNSYNKYFKNNINYKMSIELYKNNLNSWNIKINKRLKYFIDWEYKANYKYNIPSPKNYLLYNKISTKWNEDLGLDKTKEFYNLKWEDYEELKLDKLYNKWIGIEKPQSPMNFWYDKSWDERWNKRIYYI